MQNSHSGLDAPSTANICLFRLFSPVLSVLVKSDISLKVNLSLYLINDHAIHTYWAVEFLTLALDGREWSVSCPGCFTSGARAPGTHRIGGWVDPEPIWTLWIRDSSLALLGIKLQLADHPAHSLFAILTSEMCYWSSPEWKQRPKDIETGWADFQFWCLTVNVVQCITEACFFQWAQLYIWCFVLFYSLHS